MMKKLTMWAALSLCCHATAWAAAPCESVQAMAVDVGPAAQGASKTAPAPLAFEWVSLERLPDGSARGRFRASIAAGGGRGPLSRAGVATLAPGGQWTTLAAANGVAVKASLASAAQASFDPAAPESATPVEPLEAP
jgi:hypothetical protein